MRIPPEARERGRQTLIRMQKATRAALDEIVYGADPTWFIECNDERIMKCTVKVSQGGSRWAREKRENF